MIIRILGNIAALVLLCCCATKVSYWDEEDQTDAATKLMQENVFKATVRASQFKPFVLFEHSAINNTVKRSVGGSFNASQSLTHGTNTQSSISSSQPSILGLVTTASSSVVRLVGGSTTVNQDNTVGGTINPVTTHNEAYEAIETYTQKVGDVVPVKPTNGKLQKMRDCVRDDEHFPVPSRDPESEDGVHYGMKIDGVYYWIPNKYREEYFNMALVAMVKRASKEDHTGKPGTPEKPSVSQQNPKLPPALQSSSFTPPNTKTSETKELQDTANILRQIQQEQR